MFGTQDFRADFDQYFDADSRNQTNFSLTYFFNFVFGNGLYDWQPYCTTSLSRHKYQVMCYMVNNQMSRMHLELRWSGT